MLFHTDQYQTLWILGMDLLPHKVSVLLLQAGQLVFHLPLLLRGHHQEGEVHEDRGQVTPNLLQHCFYLAHQLQLTVCGI